MSITGQFTSKTGLIKVDILDDGTDLSVELDDIGKIKYKYDLVPDKPEIDAVQSLYNKVDISIFQYSYDETDIYNRLRTYLLQNGAVGVNLTVDGDIFRFLVQLNDISLKEADRVIKMDCRVRYDPNATVLGVFNAIESDDATLLKTFLPDPDNADETLECTGVADWIEYAMKNVFLNDYDAQILSSKSGLSELYNEKNYDSVADGIKSRVGFIMARMISPPFQNFEEGDLEGSPIDSKTIKYVGDLTFTGQGFLNTLNEDNSIEVFSLLGRNIFFKISSVVSDTKFTIQEPPPADAPAFGTYFYRINATLRKTQGEPAIQSLKELAAIEGAIFGSGFGNNFYINRLEEQKIVEIDWDDVTEIETKPFYNSLGSGFVQQVARTYSNVREETKNMGTDNFGIWPTDSGNWELPLITDAKAQLERISGNDTEINLSLAPGYPFLNKALGQPTQNRFLGKYETPLQWYFDFDPSLSLCRSGLNAMKKALSSDGSSDTVKFQIFSAKAIMPWNLIKFTGSNVPENYAFKLFRPTEINYDVVQDVCECEAYEIAITDRPPKIVSLQATPGDEKVTLCWEVDDFIIPKEIPAEGSVLASGTVSTLVVTSPTEQSLTVQGSVVADGSVTISVLTSDEVSVTGSVVADGSVTTSVESAIIYGDVPTACKTGTGLRVEWDADAGADNYNLQRRKDGGSWVTIATGFIGTTFNDAGPASSPTSTYEYRISACTEFGCGAYGEASIATTYNGALSC